jgi:methionyl-tRNA formyltransferase
MRIVFVGATTFGLHCLEVIAALPGIKVTGVLTLPETFPISYRPEGVKNVLYADFRPLTDQLKVPLAIMQGSMSAPDVITRLRSWRPDLIVVVGWYHFVPTAVRAIAPTVGLHASLLPDYSGGAPLVWAVINGEEKAGITLFQMDDGIDSGPIIGQAEELILEEDTIASLYARIEQHGIALLKEYLPLIGRGQAEYRPQDSSRRRVFPQRSPDDGRIDWHWSARRIYNFIRAQTRPYPGAFSEFHDQVLRIWRASAERRPGMARATAGQVVAVDENNGAFVVHCGDGMPLAVTEVEYRGKTMSGAIFFHRYAREQRNGNDVIKLGR